MSQTDPVTGAEYLARSLAANGTSHVFFIDAVLRRTLIELGALGVQRVLGHSEKAVAYMADGYARIAGRPGVCFAQSVGAANLASGLQDAYLGRVPVIAMTGHKPPSMQHRNAYQEIPHAPLFAPVTKFSARVDQAADLPRLMRLAWREAMTGTPRPAHLDLNGLQAEVIENGQVSETPAADPVFQMTLPPHRPVASSMEIERAAERILRAKKVVIVAGEGATASGAGKELLALAELLAAPIATSLGARGLVPTRHRLSVGCAGSYAAPPANQIVHEAELVVFIGCETGDQVTHTWRIPAIDTPCVQIDLDPTDIGRSYPNTTGRDGRSEIDSGRIDRSHWADPRGTLRSPIGPPASCPPGGKAGRRRWPATRRRSGRTGCATRSPRALPADGILVADTGYSSIWSSSLIELNGEGQTYLRAAGSLGWAFPAALGAKCAAPQRKVICWSGDGALYYHLTELETARRRGIAVVLVVNNNSGFGQGWPNIQRQQGNKPGDVAELVRFGPTNFADVAGVFGLRGIRVEDPSQIGPALRDALASDETVVVDVATDIDCRAPEPWLPGGK